MLHRVRSALALLLVLWAGPILAQGPPYRNAALPIGQRVRDLLLRMTPDEKFWQLFMTPGDWADSAADWSHGVFGLQLRGLPNPAGYAERVTAVQRFFRERTRLGIPIIPFEEAVHGLLQPGATMFPQAIGLAATWDTALMGEVARAIARETRSRGIRQVLAPVVNLADDVRWGRTEETYGEDPYLATLMGNAFVAAFQRAGVIATPKHFVANVGAGGRDSYPIDWNRRALEERFFPPFQGAIRSGAGSIMTAYNSVDGLPATQNPWLLNQVLKRDWKFPGFVISDAAATGGAVVLHHTEPGTVAAAKHAWEAGLDVVFQSTWEQHRPYREAFRSAGIAKPVLDSAVSRVLRAKFELGLFEQPYLPSDSAVFWNGHPEHRALALQAARKSLVLLRNQGLLPLDPEAGSVAVLGVDAVEARLGGYSSQGNRVISILDAIRDKLGPSRVRFAPGPGRSAPEYQVVPAEAFGAGLAGDYFDNPRLTGPPRMTREDPQIDFGWTFNSPGRGLSNDWYSVRWNGMISAPAGGVRQIGVEGSDGYRLYLDDRLVISNWRKESYRTWVTPVNWEPGSRHRIQLEYFETTGNGRVRLVWDAGIRPNPNAMIDSAVAITHGAEAAIVVAGIEEGEFRDRASLSLPGRQEELIREVARTGIPVAVVLIGGSAVTMSRWIDSVDAVLLAWYPGEAGGSAVAEVLFGAASPAGRLPITFPLSEGQLPLIYNHKPTGRGDDYLDLAGKPLFPFGFGLSYTRFEYQDLRIESDRIRCTVRNRGSQEGDEVVQLYLRRPVASVAQPVLQLAGFQRISLAAGEQQEVSFRLAPEQLMILDRNLRWVKEPGIVRVMIGSSSADIRLRGDLVIQ